MKKLGILGGMGPLAGAYFFYRMTEMTEAFCDAEHPETVLYSLPSIPDRTAYWKARGPSPLEALCRGIHALTREGAEGILIPCNTAFAQYSLLFERTKANILHMPRLTVESGRRTGAKALGLLATSGCVLAGVYQAICCEMGIRLILPSDEEQREIDRLIYRRKAGEAIPHTAYFPFLRRLLLGGAEKLILGCTEISLSFRGKARDECLIDALDVLAAEAILFAGFRCRPSDGGGREKRREVKKGDLSRTASF